MGVFLLKTSMQLGFLDGLSTLLGKSAPLAGDATPRRMMGRILFWQNLQNGRRGLSRSRRCCTQNIIYLELSVATITSTCLPLTTTHSEHPYLDIIQPSGCGFAVGASSLLCKQTNEAWALRAGAFFNPALVFIPALLACSSYLAHRNERSF